MKLNILKSDNKFKGLVLIPIIEFDEVIELPDGFSQIEVSKNLFSGKKDTQFIIEDKINERIYVLLGLGKTPEYHVVKTIFRRLTAKQESLIGEDILLVFSGGVETDLIEAAVSGLILGTYRLGHFKNLETEPKNWEDLTLSIISSHKNALEIAEKGIKIANAQLQAFKLVDLPPNKATPEYLAEWAKKTGKHFGISVKAFDRKKSEKEGLKAFLAVAQGSQKEPQFIIMKYRHKEATKHFGLVGKGVTFDTGGLNIKIAGMVHMKCDMGGAACVLAAMQLIADLQLPVNVTAVVPCVENVIDSQSFVPSDVIGSHSGKTIEIIDTDAEGRLILADGLSYIIKNHQPDTVIDFATLTGSAVGTFGYECAALFSNDNELSQKLQGGGMAINEKVWPLPLWDAYKSEMDSDIADIKNFHGKPIAGAITAAKFLQAFTENHPSWAHIDIAGTAFGDSEFAKTKHATAFGVHLLIKLLENK
ncbi:M17 family metallopeptidase [Aquiflexum sp.]|uniref:leucyl aminopeptidase family protein n=1 Tax=Aquiflexum sp. TaxID=1872584 RepID=UPI00359305AA